jgi:hypothetical protein
LAESGEVAKRRLIWSAFALLFYGALLVLVYAHHNWVADSIRRRWAGGWATDIERRNPLLLAYQILFVVFVGPR